MSQNESLRQELLAEVESIAPILAEHAPESEKLGRLNTPSIEEQLTAKLTEMGFSKVIHLTAEEANQRYFQNRRDGLGACFAERTMRALV